MAKTQKLGVKSISAVLDGVNVNLTDLGSDIEQELIDSTDSGDFDSVTNRVWRSYTPGPMAGSGSISGNFDLNGSSIGLIEKMIAGIPISGVMKLDTAQGMAAGNVWLEKLSYKGAIGGKAEFTADYKFDGKLTPG